MQLFDRAESERDQKMARVADQIIGHFRHNVASEFQAFAVRSLRKSRELTQAQLGALVGLDQTRIAKIERNPGLVSDDQLREVLA